MSISCAFGAQQDGQRLTAAAVDAEQHFTSPPPRFTEGSLVKALEEAGIGRPSTYAPTLQLLQVRLRDTPLGPSRFCGLGAASKPLACLMCQAA